jgi:hypothetical protein
MPIADGRNRPQVKHGYETAQPIAASTLLRSWLGSGPVGLFSIQTE